MYGMVNKAIKDLIRSRFGDEVWARTRDMAGLDIDFFVGNEAYPDEVTYGLVSAASEVTGIPAHDVLIAFGEYWVLQTAREDYGALLSAGGKSLREFLLNLPNFHARIMLMFPKLEPPTFQVTDVQDQSVRLHYLTRRGGLAPFVIGILRGLAEMFGDQVEIEHELRRDQGADHDVFLLNWEAREAQTV